MTSLVAYDDSSESENEENHKLNNEAQTTSKPYSSNAVINEICHNGAGKMLENLPQSKVHTMETRNQTTNKPQKEKNRIKIVVSSLKQFGNDDSDDEPTKRKSKENTSGLFALLPPPKGNIPSNTSFVPKVLQQKLNASPLKIITQLKIKRRKVTTLVQTDTSDDVENEFEIPETFDDETWLKVCGNRKTKSKPVVQESAPTFYQDLSNVITLAPDVQKPYSGLDNEAFKNLVGNKKRLTENIKLIDIHEDDIRPENKEWLKSLTDPNSEPKCAMKGTINNVCKIKNHITSLAQKALANDEELQMKWSENRHNRRQTQAKYGF